MFLTSSFEPTFQDSFTCRFQAAALKINQGTNWGFFRKIINDIFFLLSVNIIAFAPLLRFNSSSLYLNYK